MKIIKCLAVLGCLSITSCATLQQQISDNIKQPQVSYKTMSIGQLTSSSIELFPVFSVYNSNMFDIPVTKISYNVTVNQQKVTSGIAKNIGTLPANQDKDIQLAMRFEQQALNTLKKLNGDKFGCPSLSTVLAKAIGLGATAVNNILCKSPVVNDSGSKEVTFLIGSI